MRGGTLIAGGLSFDTPFETKNWLDHGMRFTWKEGGVRRRTGKPNLLVCHWTGAENNHRAIFRNLKRRKTKDGRGLSIHGFIDYDGVLWQYADLELAARHASAVNGRSIGFEIQNIAFPPKRGRRLPRSWRKFTRGVRVMWLKGRMVRVTLFTAEQMNTWSVLASQVCEIYGIPKTVPGDPKLMAQGANASGLVLADRIPKKRWRTYRGCIGHFAVSRKLCPGVQPLETLIDDGDFRLVRVT